MKGEMGDWIWSIITILEESGKIGSRVQVTLASSSLARLRRCWKSPSEAVTCVQGVVQQEKNTRKSWDRHSGNWEMKESTQCSKGTRFSSSLVIPSAFHLQVKGDFRRWQNCDSSKLRERNHSSGWERKLLREYTSRRKSRKFLSGIFLWGVRSAW